MSHEYIHPNSVRQSIIVLAIAPSVIIPEELCYEPSITPYSNEPWVPLASVAQF